MKQSLIRPFVSVCLLLGLVLVGCKKLEEPQPELQNTPLENIKRWYAQKTQPKQTHKSLQNSVWYPQWEASYTVRLDEQTRLVTFPVWRYKAVTYYDIGFVRRLAFRINNQDEVIDGKMLHMVGHKTYLKQFKNDLSRRYYTEGRQALMPQAMVREYEITALDIRNDKVCEATEETYLFDQDNCVVHYTSNCGNPIDYIVINCVQGVQTALFPVWDGGSGGGTGGGTSGGGTSGDTGGGGAGGGTGSIYTEDPPCDTCPADGLDSGDNTDDDVNINMLPIKLDTSMSASKNAKILCVWRKLMLNPNVRNIMKLYQDPKLGLKLEIRVAEIDVNEPSKHGETAPRGVYANPPEPDITDILMTIDEDLIDSEFSDIYIASVIIHELIHAEIYAKIAYCQGISNDCLPGIAALLQCCGSSQNKLQHEYMALTQVMRIANYLKQYVDGNATSTTYIGSLYEMLAWSGLETTDRYSNENTGRFPSEQTRNAQQHYANQLNKSRLGINPCNE